MKIWSVEMVKRKNEGGGRYQVPALARGMRMLEELAARPQGATVAEIAGTMKLPKPSVFRMLLTLLDCGYLVRDKETLSYRLSRKMLSIGYSAIDGRGLLEKSQDSLKALRDEVGEATMLAVLSGYEGVVLEQLPGLRPVMVMVKVGHRFPLHTAAPGKAMVAFLPNAERAQILDSIEYKKFTERTIVSRQAMECELAEIRERGVAYDRGEELPDIRCVAAPVLNHAGYPLAALSISGTASSMGDDILPGLAEVVRKHVDAVSRRFSI